MEILNRILKHYQNQVEWMGIRYYSENTTNHSIRNETIPNLSYEQDQGVMIEVLHHGHFAYAGTSDLSFDGLSLAFKRAQAMAKNLSQFGVHQFSTEQRPSARGYYHSPIKKNLDQASTAEIFSILQSATRQMQHEKILTRNAFAKTIETEQFFISSNDSHIEQKYQMVLLHMDSVAANTSDQQKRTWNGGLARCYQIGAEAFDREHLNKIAESIAKDAVELLNAENCPNEKLDLIIAPDQMYMQIHESIGHPLEYDRILGDERNYAGWSFVQPKDFGHLRYGSEKMNVTFDPTVPGELASYAYDECGNKAEKEYLIKNGILLKGLGSLESQTRLNLPGVANFRSASWNRAPIDRMANINLEPGNSSLQQLISQTERGMIIHSNKSWSIDDYRRKFQFGCELGQLIENGKLTKLIKNPNYRGITTEFWQQLKDTTKETDMFGSPYCGKGEPSQVIRVGHSSPYCLFSQIDVFGA